MCRSCPRLTAPDPGRAISIDRKVNDMEAVTLNNGVVMPALGLGVFQTAPEETRVAVLAALDAGYRHIDTAAAYGNERQVGEAVHSCGLDRSEVFLQTKIWISAYGYDRRCTASRRAPASSASSRSTC